MLGRRRRAGSPGSPPGGPPLQRHRRDLFSPGRGSLVTSGAQAHFRSSYGATGQLVTFATEDAMDAFDEGQLAIGFAPDCPACLTRCPAHSPDDARCKVRSHRSTRAKRDAARLTARVPCRRTAGVSAAPGGARGDGHV